MPVLFRRAPPERASRLGGSLTAAATRCIARTLNHMSAPSPSPCAINAGSSDTGAASDGLEAQEADEVSQRGLVFLFCFLKGLQLGDARRKNGPNSLICSF